MNEKTLTIDGITYSVLKCDQNGQPNLLSTNGLTFYYNGIYLRLDDVSGEEMNSETIILPMACKEINQSAFQSVLSKVKCIIGKGVTSVFKNAFSQCSKLKMVALGKLEYIGDYAFYGCKSLDYMPDLSNANYVGNSCFQRCNFKGHIDRYGHQVDGYVFIPKNVRNLCTTFKRAKIEKFIFEDGGDYYLRATFFECKDIKYCNLLDKNCEMKNTSVTFGDDVFCSSGIREAAIRPWVKFAGSSQFRNSDIEKLLFEGTAIPQHFCLDCSKLTDVVLSKDCETISVGAFDNTENLKTINLDNVKQILDAAFSCSGLESVKTDAHIGVFAFANILDLKEVEVGGGGAAERAFRGSPCIESFKIKPTVDMSVFQNNSLPIIALRNNKNIDGNQIDFDSGFFLSSQNRITNKDFFEELKKMSNRYEGGYYIKIGNNPYGCLVLYDGKDGKPTKSLQTKDVVIHPDCTLLSDYCFNKSLLDDTSNFPAYNLNYDAKYTWKMSGHNANALHSLTYTSNDAIEKMKKCAISPVFRNVIIGDDITEITNPYSLIPSWGKITLPEHMHKIILNEDMLDNHPGQIVLPKTVDEIIIPDKDKKGGLGQEVNILVRPGTDPDVVTKMLKGTQRLFGTSRSVKVTNSPDSEEIDR